MRLTRGGFNVSAGSAAPIRVVSANRTCSACPSQWEGVTDDNREVYARYRADHGYVSVSRPGATGEFKALPPEGEIVVEFEKRDGEGWDGYMDDDELRDITAGYVTWPDPAARRPEPGGENG